MDQVLYEALQKVVDMDAGEKMSMAVSAIRRLAPELRERYSNEEASRVIVSIFVASVAADGSLNDEEIKLIREFFASVGIEMSDEQVLETVKGISGEEAYRAVRALNKTLSDDGKLALVNLAAAVCSVDDRISSAEVAYISDLFND